MTIRSIALTAAAILLAAACTTTGSEQNDGATEKTTATDAAAAPTIKENVTVYNQSVKEKAPDMYCQTYMPTGSHRKVTRCISKRQKKLEQESARDALIRLNRGGASDPAGP